MEVLKHFATKISYISKSLGTSSHLDIENYT